MSKRQGRPLLLLRGTKSVARWRKPRFNEEAKLNLVTIKGRRLPLITLPEGVMLLKSSRLRGGED